MKLFFALILSLFLPALAEAQLIRAEMIEPKVLDDSKSYCEDKGSTDTYACNMSPVPTDSTGTPAYTVGGKYRIKVNTANTGAASVNFNTIGNRTIKKWVNGTKSDSATGDLGAGQVIELAFDGTDMVATSLGGGGGTGSDPTPALVEDSNSVNSSKPLEVCLGVACVFSINTNAFSGTEKQWQFRQNIADYFVGEATAQDLTNKGVNCVSGGNTCLVPLRAWFAAGSLINDGTQCADASKVTLGAAGSPAVDAIVCANNAGSTVDQSILVMNGTVNTLLFYIKVNDVDSSSQHYAGTIKAQCRASGQSPSNTWGSAQSFNITMATAGVDYVGVTSAVTPGGAPCAVGSTLYFRMTIDTGNHTDSNARLLGIGVAQAS